MDKSQTSTSAGDRSMDSADLLKPDDEHAAIATLSSSLGSGVAASTPRTPKSPAQIVSQIDHMQKEELDQIMKQLEEENLYVGHST